MFFYLKQISIGIYLGNRYEREYILYLLLPISFVSANENTDTRPKRIKIFMSSHMDFPNISESLSLH